MDRNNDKVVNPFYNVLDEGGVCSDCDKPVCKIVVSQWGDEPEGDHVCFQCERDREYEYRLIPPGE